MVRARSLDFVPQTIQHQGRQASRLFLTFFADNIRNPNTRRAYHRNVCLFFDWCEQLELALPDIQSFHVSAYIEHLLTQKSVPTVKQHLASLRMLMDWLVLGQILDVNPAHSVRSPRHVVSESVTPILSGGEVTHLFRSIDITNVVGLRDRALIGVMAYGFARVEAVTGMNVQDYYAQGKKWWIKLAEKNGKFIKIPAHRKLEEFLDAYLDAAEFTGQKKMPLFQTTRGRSRVLTGRRISRQNAWNMVRRRAHDAGIQTQIGCHSLRGSGITNFLENGGRLEDAQKMAGHSSAKTTKLYDRRDDAIKLDDVEKISF